MNEMYALGGSADSGTSCLCFCHPDVFGANFLYYIF